MKLILKLCAEKYFKELSEEVKKNIRESVIEYAKKVGESNVKEEFKFRVLAERFVVGDDSNGRAEALVIAAVLSRIIVCDVDSY